MAETVVGSLSSFSASLASLLLDSPAPAAEAAPAAKAKPSAPVAPAHARDAQSTGCSMHRGFKTVISISDLDGSEKKLEKLLDESKHIASYAHHNKNEVRYAFLGDMTPDTIPAGTSLCRTLVAYESKAKKIHDMDCQTHVCLGGREIAYLRFFERSGGEFLCLEPSVDNVKMMEAALKRPHVVPGAFPEYDADVENAFGSLTFTVNDPADLAKVHSALLLCMWLKLECACAMTKRAGYVSDASPGLLRNVLQAELKQLPQELNDPAMRCPSDGSVEGGRWLVKQVERFIKDGRLAGAGVRLVPFVYRATSIFSKFVKTAVLPLLRVGKLIDYVEPPNGYEPNSGVWLMHAGTGLGDKTIVGRLPEQTVVQSVGSGKEVGVRVRWSGKKIDNQQEWANTLNTSWLEFVDKVEKETATDADISRWIGLSMPETQSGPAESEATHQANDLGVESVESPTIALVGHNGAPYGTITSKTHGDHGHVVQVCGCTCCDNFESLFFGVATWCAKTKKFFKQHHVDRSKNLEELQIDVDILFSTLFQTLWSAPHTGTLGPVVRGGRRTMVPSGHECAELMRVVLWDDDVMTLIPEAYVCTVLHEHALHPLPTTGVVGVVGKMHISNTTSEVIPLKFGQLTPAEEMDERLEMGTRIWKLAREPSADPDDVTSFEVKTSSLDRFSGMRAQIARRGSHMILLPA